MRYIIFVTLACFISTFAYAETITNKNVGMSMSCPDGWSCDISDMKADAMKRRSGQFSNPNNVPNNPIPLSASQARVSAINIAGTAVNEAVQDIAHHIIVKQMTKHMPNMVTVNMGYSNDKSDASLNIYAGDDKSFVANAKPIRCSASQRRKMAGNKCSVVSCKRMHWGLRKVPFMVMRCKDGEIWNYSVMSMMKHGKYAFNLMGEQSSPLKTDGLPSELGSALNSVLNSFKFVSKRN